MHALATELYVYLLKEFVGDKIQCQAYEAIINRYTTACTRI